MNYFMYSTSLYNNIRKKCINNWNYLNLFSNKLLFLDADDVEIEDSKRSESTVRLVVVLTLFCVNAGIFWIEIRESSFNMKRRAWRCSIINVRKFKAPFTLPSNFQSPPTSITEISEKVLILPSKKTFPAFPRFEKRLWSQDITRTGVDWLSDKK